MSDARITFSLTLEFDLISLWVSYLQRGTPHPYRLFFFWGCIIKLRALRYTFIVEPVWFESQTDRPKKI